MGRFAASGIWEINRTFQGTHCHVQSEQIAKNKAIARNKQSARNKQMGFIRAVKGVILGQLLIPIVGFGAVFELCSANFLMKHFRAVLLVLFALTFLIAEFLACLERRVAYYAARRSV